jgi:hypothetical protein
MAFDFTPIFQKLDEIDSLTKTDWMGDEGLYSKLILIKPLCENRLKNIYADLLVQNDINHLQTNLNNLASYIQTYKSNDPNYLGHIINTINVIIPIVLKIPFVGKGETQAVLAKIIVDFSKKNADVIEKITKEKESLAKEIETLKQTISNLSSEIDKKKNEVVILTTEFQNQFSIAQDKRITDFTEAQKKRDEEFANSEQTHTSSFEVKIEEFSTVATNTLKQIEEIQKRIEMIYGTVGKSTIVGTQKDYADKSAKAARWTFWPAIGLMILVAGIVIFPLLAAMFDQAISLKDIKWEMLLYRIPIAAILLLPAFYLISESKKHREKEAKYRELEIKMATITPYFLEIGDKDNKSLSEKDKVKLELAQKLLTPSEQLQDKNIVSSFDMIELIKHAMEIINKK